MNPILTEHALKIFIRSSKRLGTKTAVFGIEECLHLYLCREVPKSRRDIFKQHHALHSYSHIYLLLGVIQ